MATNKLMEAAADILSQSKKSAPAMPMQKPEGAGYVDLGGPKQDLEANKKETTLDGIYSDQKMDAAKAAKSATAPTTKPSNASSEMANKTLPKQYGEEEDFDEENLEQIVEAALGSGLSKLFRSHEMYSHHHYGDLDIGGKAPFESDKENPKGAKRNETFLKHADKAKSAIENHVKQHYGDKVLADMKAHTHHVLSSEDGSGNDKHAQAARNIRQKYSISHDIHEEYQSDEQFIASWKEGMKEDVDALFADDSTISEEFKSKAATIFEARVTDRVQQIEEQIEAKYAGMLEEAVQAIQGDLTEKVDDYLNYVVEQWMEENQIAIESSLRSEITEDFISGLRGLFAEHYIDVPEDKVDLVDELAGQVEDLETKLNEEIQRGIEAKKALVESVKKEITHEVCEGLTDTQVEKIKSLAESVEFSTEDEYKSKLETIRENYFPSGVKKADEKQLHEEIETDETKAVATDAFVAAVSKAITRTTVK